MSTVFESAITKYGVFNTNERENIIKVFESNPECRDEAISLLVSLFKKYTPKSIKYKREQWIKDNVDYYAKEDFDKDVAEAISKNEFDKIAGLKAKLDASPVMPEEFVAKRKENTGTSKMANEKYAKKFLDMAASSPKDLFKCRGCSKCFFSAEKLKGHYQKAKGGCLVVFDGEASFGGDGQPRGVFEFKTKAKNAYYKSKAWVVNVENAAGFKRS